MTHTHDSLAAQAFAEAALALVDQLRQQIRNGEGHKALATLDSFASLLQTMGGGL